MFGPFLLVLTFRLWARAFLLTPCQKSLPTGLKMLPRPESPSMPMLATHTRFLAITLMLNIDGLARLVCRLIFHLLQVPKRVVTLSAYLCFASTNPLVLCSPFCLILSTSSNFILFLFFEQGSWIQKKSLIPNSLAPIREKEFIRRVSLVKVLFPFLLPSRIMGRKRTGKLMVE